MTVPLAVKLTTPDGSERMITRELADLTFSSKERGGFATASAPLSRSAAIPAIPELSRLTVSDTRSGRTVWEGRVLTPGRSVSSRGQRADLTAIGEGVAATRDYDGPYMLYDSDLSSWSEQFTARKDLSIGIRSLPGLSADPGLLFTGTGSVETGDTNFAWYRNLWLCGQLVGAVSYRFRSGATTANHFLDFRWGNSPDAVSTTAATDTWATAIGSRNVPFSPTSFPLASVPKFVWRMGASGAVGTTFWSGVTAANVSARVLGRNRQPVSTSRYTQGPWLRVEDVFTDVIARFCPTLDIENAHIDTGTFLYTQLAWPSGITPSQVLDEALDMEPDMTWAVWERQPNGRYRTELRHMPTQVRYEATAADGWTAPAPSSDTYDQVAVRWQDSAGLDQTSWVTAPSRTLTANGLTRTKTIDLGSEVGSQSQAVQRGQAFLADHGVPPAGGTLTVARPIWDHMEGRWCDPWEIRPGNLIRIRGVHSAPDALNATSPDGVTVSRIVDASFTASSASADLDLDAPALTEQRLIARMINARRRK